MQRVMLLYMPLCCWWFCFSPAHLLVCVGTLETPPQLTLLKGTEVLSNDPAELLQVPMQQRSLLPQ